MQKESTPHIVPDAPRMSNVGYHISIAGYTGYPQGMDA